MEKPAALFNYKKNIKEQIQTFVKEIKVLKEKNNLNNPSESRAGFVAQVLVNYLEMNLQNLDTMEEKTLSAFQIKCKKAIKHAQVTLEKQSGWGNFLKNLLLCVAGVGFISIGYKYKKGKYLFFNDSALVNINNLEEAITNPKHSNNRKFLK